MSVSCRNLVPSLGDRSIVRALGLAALALLCAAAPAAANVYQYENTTSAAIPNAANDNVCTSGASALNITFSVPDSFTASAIAVGLTIDHNRRGDVRAVLTAPDNSNYVLFEESGDTDDDYDILVSGNSDAGAPGTAPLDDGDDDPVAAPFFNRLVTVGALNANEGAAGTWTLRLCDRNSGGGGVTGTHLRSRLVLTDATAATSACYSRMNYEWGTNGNNAQFTSATTGGITITQNAAGRVDYAAGFGATNQVTSTATANGETGYYSLFMDGLNTGGTQDSEIMGQLAAFQFSLPVNGLQFSLIDTDQADGDFEDVMRVEGTRSGAFQRYQRTIGSAHQAAGDMIEGDTGTTGAAGTSTYLFDRQVDTASIFWFAGDDETPDPGDQFVGITNLLFCAFDYGDAPSTYGTALNGGARHLLGNRELYLGAVRPDGEADGQANFNASLDDANQVGGLDDEDGVGLFPACPNNGSYTVSVSARDLRTAGADATLVGFIDWNRNGAFDDGTNEESAAVIVPRTDADPTSYNVTWSAVPANCGGATATFARFRFTTDATRAGSPVDGAALSAPDGEVEDYQISGSTLPVTLARVETERQGDGVVVRWSTATETANAGFRIWGNTADGGRVLLATYKSPSADSLEPRHYETTLRGRGVTSIEIEDVSLLGDNRVHGPFAVGAKVGEDPEVSWIDWNDVRVQSRVATPLDRVAAAERGESLRFAPTTDAKVEGTATATSGLLLVRAEGIHRISYESLVAGGIDLTGVDPRQIALLDEGKAVSRFVAAPGGSFGPGGYIEFLAQPRLTLASPVDALVLTLDSRKASPVGNLGPTGVRPGTVAAEDRYHSDRQYSFASPNGDPWYDQSVLAWGAPASMTRTFDLPGLANGPVGLRVSIWGYTDLPGESPDHHVVLEVNGVEVASEIFDGISPLELDLDVTDAVTETGNTLTLRVPGDTGQQFDYVAFEGFDVTYSRASTALDGKFRAPEGARAPFAIDGFADGELVTVWATHRSGARRGEVTAIGGAVGAPAKMGVWASAAPALLTPGVVAGLPVASRSTDADYLIVTHPAFVGSLDPLVALERSRGLTTEVVTVDSIYAAYSDYVASPDAIRDFIRVSSGKSRLKYVLIVGSDTVDPWDHLGLGSISFVPTNYLKIGDVITFSPTDEAYVDRNNDGLGELPIGRLPVRTPAELDASIAKLIAWEANLGFQGRKALLAAGASDAERAISSVNEAYRTSLSAWRVDLAQVDDLGTAATRQRVLDAFAQSTPLIGFVGHSSPGQWDFSPVLRWQDAASLPQEGLPVLVAAWGCWNSYYVNPGYESLSAHLLRVPGGGAAAAIGATTLTTDTSHRALGTLFYQRVAAGARTVGEAFRGAKQDLFATGSPKDAIYGMTLLGDPAMGLPPRP